MSKKQKKDTILKDFSNCDPLIRVLLPNVAHLLCCVRGHGLSVLLVLPPGLRVELLGPTEVAAQLIPQGLERKKREEKPLNEWR